MVMYTCQTFRAMKYFVTPVIYYTINVLCLETNDDQISFSVSKYTYTVLPISGSLFDKSSTWINEMNVSKWIELYELTLLQNTMWYLYILKFQCYNTCSHISKFTQIIYLLYQSFQAVCKCHYQLTAHLKCAFIFIFSCI